MLRGERPQEQESVVEDRSSGVVDCRRYRNVNRISVAGILIMAMRSTDQTLGDLSNEGFRCDSSRVCRELGVDGVKNSRVLCRTDDSDRTNHTANFSVKIYSTTTNFPFLQSRNHTRSD
jgi:hypothetical protein